MTEPVRTPDARTLDAIGVAAALTILVGFFGLITGFSGVVRSAWLVAALSFGNPRVWGWLMVILGAIQLVVGLQMGRLRVWALWGGGFLAIVSIVFYADCFNKVTPWAILLVLGNVGIVVLTGLGAMAVLDTEREAEEERQAVGA